MGLALEVGILADLKEADPEGFEYHAAALARLNRFLKSRDLPPHREPDDCEVWSGEMIGYSGLHDLRRLAAYLDCEAPLPTRRSRNAAKDPCLAGYYASVDGRRPGWFQRLFGPKTRYRRGFDHLIVHGDAEGYYLPADFPDVLFPPPDLEVPGGMVGSAPRLLAELDRIAAALAIPDGLTPDAQELWQAADDPTNGGELWQQYGRESFGCVTLRHACRQSIAQRAALVFI
jgi:hypothetical protein